MRKSNLGRLQKEEFDVLILGGGINGAVSAASLAARGVKVALIERDDFASHTSSNASNLAWGGIKYLESFEFLLVNHLCQSRNHLMESYPSTVKEIRFLTTIQKGFRFHPFLVYLGTLLYWMIGRFRTRPPKYLSAARIERLEPVVDTSEAVGGFEYSDCYLHDNDARFVFNFIRTSLNYGCVAANYVKSNAAHFNGVNWITEAEDTMTGNPFRIRSRALINACGPWVDLHNQHSGQKTEHCHLFSKGIHLIFDRIGDSRKVLTFFARDGRMFFVIPMGPKTCVGTTDTQVDLPEVAVTEQDRNYVLENINACLDLPRPLNKEDIIAERCGVRPLAIKGRGGVADWVKLSRKHAIEVNTNDRHVSIFGGKLTDCLNVGDEIAEIVGDMGIPVKHPGRRWYGEPVEDVRQEFLHQAELMQLDRMTSDTSSEPLSRRFWRRYGINAMELLERIREDPDSAELLIENSEYLRCEIELTARREMVTRLEDFLRRRSKIEQVVRRKDIIEAPGLADACAIFFGNQAEVKLQEYIDA